MEALGEPPLDATGSDLDLNPKAMSKLIAHAPFCFSRENGSQLEALIFGNSAMIVAAG